MMAQAAPENGEGPKKNRLHKSASECNIGSLCRGRNGRQWTPGDDMAAARGRGMRRMLSDSSRWVDVTGPELYRWGAGNYSRTPSP